MPNRSFNWGYIAGPKDQVFLNPQRTNQRDNQPRLEAPPVSDDELYGHRIEHALQSSASRPVQVGFYMPSKSGGTSLGCLLEEWSLNGPHRCVTLGPDLPLFLEKWERVPSLQHLGKELGRVCGDPHLFGYISKSRGPRRVSTFMLNRAAWGFLFDASLGRLLGGATYIPYEVARFVVALDNTFDLGFGDAVKFSLTNGRLTRGELIFARGWHDMPPPLAK